MIFLKSLCSAFLMYSRIPMPQVEWKEENRRYALCFFPCIGAVIGGLMMLWKGLCGLLNIGNLLFAAVATVIPLVVTGGIHADGFCDVVDAQSSYGDRKRKLEIMSDSHIGAFAVIYTVVYFLLTAALFTEVAEPMPLALLICALGFILSRVLSAFAAVTFKSAKNEGTLQSFVVPAHKKITLAFLGVEFIAVAAAMLATDFIIGGIAIVSALLMLIYFRVFSYKNYGGITGDMAGYFLQLCELAILAAVVLGVKIMGVIS